MNWLKIVSQFRQSPESYLVSQNNTEETFILDVLQAVCSDSIQDEEKCHIFILLQEYADELFSNNDIIEQAVVSLEDIFQQCRVNWTNSKNQLASHILSTISTVLIVKDQLNSQTQLFRDFVNILLGVISQVNTINQCLIRRCACHCLEEIEINYPGILRQKVDHLYQMCQLDKTIVNQSYTSLYATVLKNTVAWIAENEKCSSETYLTETLHDRREPLKPLYLPDGKDHFMLKPTVTDAKRIPDFVDISELKKLVSAILDNSPYWTASTHFRILRNLSDVVLQVPEFPPTIFTQQILRFVSTFDLPLFHIVMELQMKFGSDILTDDEVPLALQCLLSNLHHPSADIGQRLMMYEWLLHYPNEKNIPKQPSVPSALDYTQYASLFPRVFDGIDTTVKKMDVLSLCFIPGENADSASAILISSLMTMHKPVHYGTKGRLTAALFKVLYLLYTRHSKTYLTTEIQKLCLTVFLEQPQLAPYILDFINNIRKFDNESKLPVELLTSIMDQVVSLDSERLFPNVNEYLQLVRRAVMEPSIKPQTVMAFLIKLTESVDDNSLKEWGFGLKILHVCQTLLLQHGSSAVYSDMAALLLLLINIGDIDVHAQAEITYNILMTVSGSKISSIFPAPRENLNETNQSFSSLMSDQASYPCQAPCHQVEPVLKLERLCDVNRFGNLKNNDVLNVKLPLELSIMPDYGEPIFSIELKFDSVTTQFTDIKPVNIPALKSDIENPIISVDFVPKNPLPGTIEARATFTAADGKQKWCVLPVIEITFCDLFLPIHSSTSTTSFSEMWKLLEERQATDPTCCMTLFSFKNDDKLKNLIASQLSQFVCEKDDTNDSETCLGIYLPPNSHLLLKCEPVDEKIVIKILTDDLDTLHSTYFYLKQNLNE